MNVRYGFAAGCEAWLCRAVGRLKTLGLGPWFGPCPLLHLCELNPESGGKHSGGTAEDHAGKARTRGAARRKKKPLAARHSHASHPAAKPHDSLQLLSEF